MRILTLALLSLALPGRALGQQSDPAGADMMAAAAQFMQAFQGGTNNPLAAMGGKNAVDFRELRDLLPPELAGLPRTGAGGERTGAFGMNVTTATGRYGAEAGPRLEVTITDLGAMGPAAAMASFGWTSTEVDRESGEGYERTVQYKERKGLEQYTTADKSGSVKVMTGGRFMVEIGGNDIDPAQLKTAAESFDFDALDRLGNRPEIE